MRRGPSAQRQRRGVACCMSSSRCSTGGDRRNANAGTLGTPRRGAGGGAGTVLACSDSARRERENTSMTMYNVNRQSAVLLLESAGGGADRSALCARPPPRGPGSAGPLLSPEFSAFTRHLGPCSGLSLRASGLDYLDSLRSASRLSSVQTVSENSLRASPACDVRMSVDHYLPGTLPLQHATCHPS